MLQQNRTQVLEALIAEKIVDEEAKKEGIEPSKKEIEEEIEKIKEESGGEQGFQQLLQYYGYELKDLEANITMNLKIKRSEEHTSELQSRGQLVFRLLLEKKKKN